MDLESLVTAFGPQPAARVIHLLIQACNSLAEAHDAGLVHRDIKPANLFICRAADELDVVKLLDFGLVRAAAARPNAVGTSSDAAPLTRRGGASDVTFAPGPDDALTRAGGLMGTPGYMAPEQALGHTIDHRADLYALGCVAFWLLTGRVVYDDANPMRLMLAHVNQPIPDVRAAAQGFLPDDLAALIHACLAKSPADRPASARDLGHALRAIPIPPEHAWTQHKVEAWWNRYRPRRRSLRGPPDASREFNVAVTLP
jgi:serine/threonine-protein kinase